MYCKPLKMRSMSGSTADTKILTDKQISKIFQNVETIKDIAKAVWKKLESASKTWPESAPRIGNIILTSVRSGGIGLTPIIFRG
jgi:ERCC4-type nuclease